MIILLIRQISQKTQKPRSVKNVYAKHALTSPSDMQEIKPPKFI